MNDAQGYFNLINKQYSQLLAKEIIIAYDGDVTHQVMKAFTSLVEEKLDNENENETTSRRLYHILVECLQNINRHAESFHPDEEFDQYPGRGALLLSRTDSHYRVITANIVKQEQVEEMKDFLDKINHMTDEELDSIYKEVLKNGKLSARGGAGLGFIDVRRKISGKMDYEFSTNDNETSYFLFNVTISR